MDAVGIEHRFGDILGAEGRGHEADADTVRLGRPEHLAEALDSACEVLTKRAEGLANSDPLHLWIEKTIETAKARAEVLKTVKLQEMKEATKTEKLVNYTLPLWEAYADSLHLIHMYLKSKDL
jgi:hypothetical protein